MSDRLELLTRLRVRHIVGIYLVAVIVINLARSARDSGGLGGWSFWLIDTPVAVSAVGITVAWMRARPGGAVA